MAAGIFVPVHPRHRKRRLPGVGHILECLRLDLGEHASVDADIGDADAAAIHPPGQQQMRRLAAEEGHGRRGAHGGAHHEARGAVDAARQIDREHRRAIGIDRLDHLDGLALHRPVEARAEQRVDDQRRLAERLRVERQHRIFPAARSQRRIALQAVAFAQQRDRYLAPARGKFGGRDKTVAAIVAAAGDHHDRTLVGKIHRGFRHGLARAQHQREARPAGRDRQAIGALHFRGGENFHAKSLIQTPVTEAHPFPTGAQPRPNCIRIDLFAYLVG